MKKCLKLFISMIVILTMLMNVTAFAASFSDVPTTHWAFEYVSTMAYNEVVNGYEDGSFIPDGNVTRAEAAAMMFRVSGEEDRLVTKAPFDDVQVHSWYALYVDGCKDYFNTYYENGEINFHPDDTALREDVVSAIVKMLGYNEQDADITLLSKIADSSDISEYARPYIAIALEKGIVSGYGDNTIKPKGNITRAEIATVLYRVYKDELKPYEVYSGTNVATFECITGLPLVEIDNGVYVYIINEDDIQLLSDYIDYLYSDHWVRYSYENDNGVEVLYFVKGSEMLVMYSYAEKIYVGIIPLEVEEGKLWSFYPNTPAVRYEDVTGVQMIDKKNNPYSSGYHYPFTDAAGEYIAFLLNEGWTEAEYNSGSDYESLKYVFDDRYELIMYGSYSTDELIIYIHNIE